MIAILVTLEDISIKAEFVDDKWVGTCRSETREEEFSWTYEELSAVINLMLGVGEEEIAGYDVPHLYSIAEEAIAGWKSECRPFP